MSISILGHGGMGSQFKYPKNTIISFDRLLEVNNEGTELDLQITKDSVLVLYHDEKLETLTNGSGKISDLTWQELKNVQYNSPFLDNLSILRLEDFVTLIPNKATYILSLDCRVFNLNSKQLDLFARSIKRFFDNSPLKTNLIIECKLGNNQWIASVKTILKGYKIFATGNYSIMSVMNEAQKNDFVGIGVSSENINKSDVILLHNNKLKVMVWDIYNKRDFYKALSYEVDYIQCDTQFF